MIQGEFGSKGQLLVAIDLIDVEGEPIQVDALLDTGFTEWVAINNQDIESFVHKFYGLYGWTRLYHPLCLCSSVCTFLYYWESDKTGLKAIASIFHRFVSKFYI
ncbi:hypothetical protein [Coleofasciculus sp. H7-2]|uniref:hypothetical protein n=1 Tax=Coleofasciculus sp. H7-2 TaxID=3351545 RepID=UPI00366D5FC6